MTSNADNSIRKAPPLLKASLLFSNFLLIIMAYYLVKNASRSMILEDSSADILPYIWIGSALFLMVLVPAYQLLVARVERFKIIVATLLCVAAILVVFRLRFEQPTLTEVILFYVFVDVFSVILVEQFWSLTNSVYRTSQAKNWYGLIGSGGLAGGLVAGILVIFLVERMNFATPDLLWLSAIMVGIIIVLTLYMRQSGYFTERPTPEFEHTEQPKVRELMRENNYLFLVAAILLLAQMASPFIEYQFMSMVKENYLEQDPRTAFLAKITLLTSSLALIVNLMITPLLHRVFGAIGGLVVQPLALIGGSILFMTQPVISVAAGLKIFDRGLSYSINRASRELLYVPISTETVYRAKAWIDMLGYRLFKVLGSAFIILMTKITGGNGALSQLSPAVIGLCVFWLMAILMIRARYRSMVGFAKQNGLEHAHN